MAANVTARNRARQTTTKNLENLRLLSVCEAAAMLGVSPWSVRRLIASGALPSRRILDRVLISQNDLAIFVEEARVQ